MNAFHPRPRVALALALGYGMVPFQGLSAIPDQARGGALDDTSILAAIAEMREDAADRLDP